MRAKKALIGFSLFAVVAIAATYLIWSTLQRAVSGDTHTYTATFSEVLGLRTGDDVRVAGVRVGRVESIELDDAHRAQVGLTIKDSQQLYTNTKALVRYQNLIGQRYVALATGDGDSAPLEPGGDIPLERTEPSFDVSTLLAGFQPLFSVLQPDEVNSLSETMLQALQGNGVSLSSLITQSAALATTFGERDAILGDVIHNLSGVIAGLANRSSELETLIAQARTLVAGLSEQGEMLKGAVEQVAVSTNSLADLLTQVKPSLARAQDSAEAGVALLLSNGPALDQAAVELPLMLTGLARFTSYGAYGTAYLCSLDVSLWGVLLPRGLLTQIGGNAHTEVCR